MRSYWVVSPNVNNWEATVLGWKNASVAGSAAFMGYKPDDEGHKGIGPKFANTIAPGDVILIARRFNKQPDVVGFGIVRGTYKKSKKDVKVPEGGRLGSLRNLRPFIVQRRPPAGIPLIQTLGHTTALAQLHPDRHDAHALVCNWMDKRLKDGKPEPDDKRRGGPEDTKIVASSANHQLDYIVRTRKQVTNAKNKEGDLLKRYRLWLGKQGRKLVAARYKKLQCDGFEQKYRNLIEAKSSISREHIRMAVGQLLDYAFQGEEKLGKPNMGILLPEEPDPSSVGWLAPLKINLIWRKKKVFLDDANGRFT